MLCYAKLRIARSLLAHSVVFLKKFNNSKSRNNNRAKGPDVF